MGGGCTKETGVELHNVCKDDVEPEVKEDLQLAKGFISPNCVEGEDRLGNKTVNEYTIIRQLGRKTSLAINTNDTLVYAIRRCPRPPRAILNAEVMILLRISHPNIIYMFEVIFGNPDSMLVLQWMEGGPLMKQSGASWGVPFAEDQVKLYLRQAVSGLRAMHTGNIAHGNICPQCFLVDRSRQRLVIGGLTSSVIFRSEDDTMRKKTEAKILAPEVNGVCTYSAKSVDTFCLGVSVYIMLRGILPDISPTGKYLPDPELPPKTNLFLSDVITTPFQRLTLPELEHHSWLQHDIPRVGLKAKLRKLIQGSEVTKDDPVIDRIVLALGSYIHQRLLVHIISSFIGEGHISTARTGEDVVKLCGRSRFRLLIMDIGLEGNTNTLEVASVLREQEAALKLTPLPIIGLTREGDYQSAARIQAGFTRVISKPLQQTTIYHLLRQYGFQAGDITTVMPPVPFGTEEHAFMREYTSTISSPAVVGLPPSVRMQQ